MKNLLLIGMVFALATAAFAYPTLAGPTGLANLPTAAVQPAGVFDVAADFYNIADDTLGTDDSIPLRVVYGITPALEAGALFNLNADGVDDAWGINAKYKTPLTIGGFAWALGAQYISLDTSPDSTNATQVYFVGSRALGTAEGMPAINGTVGVNWTREKDGIDADAIRAFVGADLAFANKLSLAAEFQTKSKKLDDEALWSVVARYPFTPALAGQIGFTNSVLGIAGSKDSNVFVGLKYSFGTAAEE